MRGDIYKPHQKKRHGGPWKSCPCLTGYIKGDHPLCISHYTTGGKKRGMKKEKVITLKDQVKKAVCYKHSAKMEGMISLSTSAAENPQCKANSLREDWICHKCYALRQLKVYPSLNEKLKRNYHLLTENRLTPEDVPLFNCIFFRFEAFGDLANKTQALNYLLIADCNPQTHFALWTKNPLILAAALKEYGHKPKNLQIILSSPVINSPIKNTFGFVDKVFTVYEKDYAEKNNININCGARNCFKCHKCYKKNAHTVINELVK